MLNTSMYEGDRFAWNDQQKSMCDLLLLQTGEERRLQKKYTCKVGIQSQHLQVQKSSVLAKQLFRGFSGIFCLQHIFAEFGGQFFQFLHCFPDPAAGSVVAAVEFRNF